MKKISILQCVKHLLQIWVYWSEIWSNRNIKLLQSGYELFRTPRVIINMDLYVFKQSQLKKATFSYFSTFLWKSMKIPIFYGSLWKCPIYSRILWFDNTHFKHLIFNSICAMHQKNNEKLLHTVNWYIQTSMGKINEGTQYWKCTITKKFSNLWKNQFFGFYKMQTALSHVSPISIYITSNFH